MNPVEPSKLNDLSEAERIAIGEHAAGVKEYAAAVDHLRSNGTSLEEYLSTWRIDNRLPRELPISLASACEKLQRHYGAPTDPQRPLGG